MDQIEREYRGAMDELQFSDAGKGRIMKNLMEAEKKSIKGKRFRPGRSALIAAAVCLALVGAAVATQYFGVRIVDGAGTSMDVQMEGGITYYPVDILSDEIKALENEHRFLSFGSWQEAEDFIGVDLMNNPTLDSSPAEHYCVEYTDGKDQYVTGRFVMATSVGLGYLRLHGCYEIGDVNIDVEGFLFTDHMTEQHEDWDERFYGISFAEDVQTGGENYTTKNGLEVQIVTVERPGGDSCMAAFSVNGIPFIVKAKSENSPEEAREVLYQVLDGFVLG